jgi:hypothetical protein
LDGQLILCYFGCRVKRIKPLVCSWFPLLSVVNEMFYHQREIKLCKQYRHCTVKYWNEKVETDSHLTVINDGLHVSTQTAIL